MPEHVLRQLTPRVWWLNPVSTTDRPTLGVVAGDRASLVVDAGNSPDHARALRGELERAGLPAPRLAVLTHWHWDHVFGAATLDLPALASTETQRVVTVMAGLDWSDAALDQRVAEGIEIAFCRDMIRAELPDRAGLRIRPPEIAFESAVTVDLGGVTCRLIHVGGDHSPDAIVVHVVEDRSVFIGDATYDDLYHGPRRLTVTQHFPLLDRLLELDVDYYIAGHDAEPITREQFEKDAGLLKLIGAAVARIGDDRDAVCAALVAELGAALLEEHVEMADAFLSGLRLREVSSPL